jgi:hypothetical protein
MMPPLSTNQLHWWAPKYQKKAGMLGPWHCWGGWKVPKLAQKPEPPIHDCLPNSSVCFSACRTPQELPVTQLARHVNLFHLVITDNQTRNSLPPPWLGPS